jgi:cell division protein FtsI/penicillin-binding protein 2
MPEGIFRRRLSFLFAAIVFATTGIVLRLVDVQLLDSQSYRDRARKQHECTVKLEGQRGSITDRNGRELAVSIEVDSVFVHPWQLKTPAQTARSLSAVLGLDTNALIARFRSPKSFVWVKRKISPVERRRIEELGLEDPVHFTRESKRFYPKASLASHTLGFVGTDGLGLEGVEKDFDAIIRGEGESFVVLRDAKGGAILQKVRQAARHGAGLELTIDEAIQHAAELYLDRAMRRSRSKKGTIIVSDPRTGEILDLANRPTYDPKQFSTKAAADMKKLAVGHRYEPGSTFKIITAAAALEEGRIRPTDWLDCGSGSILVSGIRIRDHHEWRSLCFADVIAKSSNVGIIRVGLRLGAPLLHSYVRLFGFGRPTGIGLSGEAAGIVNDLSRWSDISVASVSIGQEIAVTPIQMLQAYSAIANSGLMVPPRLIRAIVLPDGRRVAPPRPGHQRILSPSTARRLTSMMERVVVSGTGQAAGIAGYRVAGKTGTAQKVGPDGRFSHELHTASFIGFAPVNAPRIAAIVLLDEPRGKFYGGEVAAPWFSSLVSDALERLRVRPDDGMAPPAGESASGRRDGTLFASSSGGGSVLARKPLRPTRPPRTATDPDTIPDLTGLSLRDAVTVLSDRGFRVHTSGSGYVSAQDPPAGSRAPKGSFCRLSLSIEPSPEPVDSSGAEGVRVARR